MASCGYRLHLSEPSHEAYLGWRCVPPQRALHATHAGALQPAVRVVALGANPDACGGGGESGGGGKGEMRWEIRE